MNHCLSTFETSGPQGLLFDESIRESPRFSYTPQFWDTTLGSGGSLFPNVMRFRSVWIQGTWWKRGTDWSVHHPGEGCDTTGGGTCSPSESMQQVSALVIPDLALPIELRGNPPPNGGLNPFQPTLFK